MKKVFYSIVIIVVLFLGFSFSYLNNQIVTLNYLGHTKDIHLSILLLLTLGLGVVVGYVFGLLPSIKTRRALSRTKKQLSSLDNGNP